MRSLRDALLLLTLGLGAALAIPGAAQEPPQLSAARPASAAAPVHATSKPTPAPRPKAPPATAVAAAPAPSGTRLAPGAPIPPAELEAFVDGVVREAMTSRHIAGVAVSVVQDGQVVLKKGYGFAGQGRAVDPDQTLFRIGSISKTFTWIAAMKEVEAGRLRLDGPVNLYLPEAVQVRDQGYPRQVLVRDLMTHSPGFEDRALGQLFEEDPGRIRPLAEYLREERPRRVRPAGQVSVYSNYGAMLAGEAVSYVNGHPFQDIIDNEIATPLGMTRTTFREPYPATRTDLPKPMPAALIADLSTGYRWAGGGFQPQRFEFVTQGAPAGAASSTAGDMARYMLMILNGGQLDGATIYGPDTARGFRTTLQTNAPGVNGWDDGFMEFALPGGFRGQGHGGDTLWFHSEMVVVPALNLGVFVTTNTDTGPGLATTLPDRIVERFYAPPPPFPRAGVPSLADEHAVYAGTYVNDRRPYGGLQKFVFLLISQATVSVTKDGRLLTSGGDGPHAWVPDGPPGRFVSVDGAQTTAFQIADGRAVRWFTPSGASAFDRVGPLYQAPVLAAMTALAALVAIATLVGLAVRDNRELRQTATQARASLAQTTVSVLWLLCMAIFGVWAAGSGDVGRVMYGWPGPLVLVASACALVAAMLTLLTVVLTPVVWRGGRRLDSWSVWRKLRFTLTTAVFAAFAVQLFFWGALAPWSA
ncbi:MAG TPA: serine hydrolase domain-containing protein [Caulobacteraceae bacterium]|nr:serine hydrolase domain-containing protein [Caulobacteraceae bacterium]